MSSSLLLITDTNIWIDLQNGEVLSLIFELPYKSITTDFAVDEMEIPPWEFLKSLGLEAYGLSSDQITDIYVMNQNYPPVSTTDLSCMVLARDLSAILLSGDKPLRTLAETQAIEVHGVLWVLDALVDHQIITQSQACLSLKRMLAHNARLPERSCNKRFKKWRSDV
ncbi:MAG: type II toxin-antitoxin system VapC family toxin [Thermotogota bacterium]|nr:type II toxin-antitoxin system VapC family toxin [Thermotogota bacterium]